MPELRSCVKVEVAVLGSLSLTVLNNMVSLWTYRNTELDSSVVRAPDS